MKSYAQSGQDLFAFNACGQKTDGTFVDIGCNDPVINNNTYALELLGWTGVCVDIERFDYSGRKVKFVKADATQIIHPLESFILQHKGRIDYLSVDADDATFDCLERLVPFYKFGCITVEHDVYRVGPEVQQKIYEFLKTFNYRRANVNVLAPRCDGMPWSEQPYEDWYILNENPVP